MKNPLKNLGGKLKSYGEQFVAKHKPESPKKVVDGLGDSGIIGGLALLGTSMVMPAAPATMLLAGAIFIAGGASAKFVASKMSAPEYDVTKPAPEKPAASLPQQSLLQRFKKANAPKQAPQAKAAAKPGLSPTL